MVFPCIKTSSLKFRGLAVAILVPMVGPGYPFFLETVPTANRATMTWWEVVSSWSESWQFQALLVILLRFTTGTESVTELEWFFSILVKIKTFAFNDDTYYCCCTFWIKRKFRSAQWHRMRMYHCFEYWDKQEKWLMSSNLVRKPRMKYDQVYHLLI